MSDQVEIWTVGRLLTWTIDFFNGKGIESPLLDAQVLLAKAMGIARIELYTRYSIEPTVEQRTKFRELVKRRGAGEPAAYLVGSKEFYSIPFTVNSNVLIPRPETEHLVLKALDKLKILAERLNNCNDKSDVGGVISICDVGTGSGAVAVAIAKNYSRVLQSLSITATDISPAAIEVAKLNAKAAGVLDQINFVQSDLFDAFDEEIKFDVIVSNPPYVSSIEYDNLPIGIKKYEPKLALLAGDTGAEIIAKLTPQATKKIKTGGYFLLEISPMIAENVKKILEDNGWQNIEIFEERIVCCEKLPV